MFTIPLRFRGAALICLILLLFGCSRPILQQPVTYVEPKTAQTREATFEAIWEKMSENELIGNFGGEEWEQTYSDYKEKVTAIESEDAFVQLMNELVQEVPNSQITLITREDRINRALAQGPNRSTIGAFTGIRDEAEENRRLVVLHIMPDSPAEKAGIRPHDSILMINGEPININEGRLAQIGRAHV